MDFLCQTWCEPARIALLKRAETARFAPDQLHKRSAAVAALGHRPQEDALGSNGGQGGNFLQQA